jgi:hypothetical protein
MTEKLPTQSSGAVIRAASRGPASSGFGIGIRSNTTPQVRGSADRLASSPKSLSKEDLAKSPDAERVSDFVTTNSGYRAFGGTLQHGSAQLRAISVSVRA